MKILVIAFAVCVGLVCTQAQAQWHVNVLWQRQGLQDSSGYGALILPLGDQNDDGYADWAVFAAATQRTSEPDSCYLEFFHGGNPPSTTPYFTYDARIAGVWHLYGAWAIGDVNGDHYQDWMVEAQHQENWQWFEAQIFYGGPGDHSVPDARWHFHWETDDEQFHWIGDFNGDGFADLYKWRRNGDVGFACFGSAAFDTIPDWTRHSPSNAPMQSYPNGSGDINGDHLSDFISTIWPNPSLCIFRGGTQPDTLPYQVLPLPGHTINLWSNVVNDLNRDGRADILVLDLYSIEVHFGRDTIRATPDATLSFPYGVVTQSASLGDINGDGQGDFAAVDLNGDNGNGGLALYLGNYQMTSQPTWILDGRGGPPYLVGIRSAAGLGDINGDGINDIAIGSTNEDNDGIRGKAVIISGDTSVHVAADVPRPVIPGNLALSAYPNPCNSATRISFELPRSGAATINVYDVQGRQSSWLSEGVLAAGKHEILFDASGLASGIYFIALNSNGLCTHKLMVLK